MSNWVVVSFQTATVEELIEERPDPKNPKECQQKKYADRFQEEPGSGGPS